MFNFIQAIEGIDFKGALKVLADKAGVEIVYQKGQKSEDDERDRLFAVMDAATLFFATHLNEGAREYLKKRGMNDESMKTFRLGFAGNGWTDALDQLKKKGFSEKDILDAGVVKRSEQGRLVDKFRNRIMFPIADSAGRIVAFSGRTFGPDAHPDAPKYLNSPETPLFKKSRILYGFDTAKLSMRKLHCAVLVEGQMDLVMSHQAGWTNTVAVSGTAFTAEHAHLLLRMTENLILALDPDEAGVKAVGRAARLALAAGLNVKVAQLPPEKDPADLIRDEGPDVWKDIIKNAKDIITFLLDVIEARTSDKDRMRRMVEAAVLPFIIDVKSPIAREHYIHEIADRLSVSEAAVIEAVKNLPEVPREAQHETAAPVHVAIPPKSKKEDRAQRAYAILLWQETLPKPLIDCGQYAADLAQAVGPERFSELSAIPDTDRERLRFGAEGLYTKDRSPQKDIVDFIQTLHRERLSSELEGITREIKVAERKGDSEALESILARSRSLTADIAKLHKEV